MKLVFASLLLAAISLPALAAQCHVAPATFDGWQAQQMVNDWVTLTFVPQLGGRLMQVEFNQHAYLFVNPAYKGKNISPQEANGRWINYGGDKIWPLPEGDEDEQHWQGSSTALDDGDYAFTVVAQGNRCTVRLQGPPDPPTGLQYTREISIGSDSPRIFFHALTHNFTGHSIAWSVQSVSQYNLSDARDAKEFNHDFWAITPLNPSSAYLLGYHARDGLANDPSYGVDNGLFRLHWKYVENEVWLDSTAGWVAVVDGASQYAMIEETRHVPGGDYPGKASVIFYKNGPMMRVNADGRPELPATTIEETPYYMEAEVNSPMATLGPGETYTFDTTWLPTRSSRDLKAVTDPGVVMQPLSIKREGSQVTLTGLFGVFYPGKLKAFFYDRGGFQRGEALLASVQPQEPVALAQTISAEKNIARISLHLVDTAGIDRGALGEGKVTLSHEGQ